jgi:hypothetical protein
MSSTTGRRVGRLMTMKAQPGRGDELATALLDVATGLRDFPGCETYLISQDRTSPDTVYVVSERGPMRPVRPPHSTRPIPPRPRA